MASIGDRREQVLIVGGGISGLALLHSLLQGGDPPRALLLEASDRVGGTMRTRIEEGTVFDEGPNGFLDGRPWMRTLLGELGAEEELLSARPQAAIRYVACRDRIWPLPTGPAALWGFRLLSWRGKARLAAEIGVPRGDDEGESVHDFAVRRLGREAARVFIEPMVHGIFAGDARRLHLTSSFPRIREMERRHGSLMRAWWRLHRNRPRPVGQPTGRLTTLRGGMGRLPEILADRWRSSIRTREPVRAIHREGRGFVVVTEACTYFADRLALSVPAPEAAALLRSIDGGLSAALEAIPYVPVAVVGLLYEAEAAGGVPDGYGYLRMREPGAGVLGALFTHRIFPGRCREDQVFLRVMVGGALAPRLVEDGEAACVAAARREVERMFGIRAAPLRVFTALRRRAIPQYSLAYPALRERIEEGLARIPSLSLVANYIGGISMADCVRRARETAGRILASVGEAASSARRRER